MYNTCNKYNKFLFILLVMLYILLFQLVTHQRIDPDCLTKPGKCFYFDYCGFESSTIEELQRHLKENSRTHLESLTLKIDGLDQLSTKATDTVIIALGVISSYYY